MRWHVHAAALLCACAALALPSGARADGLFATWRGFPVSPNPRYVAAGDLDNDSVVDLVASTREGSDGFVSVLLGNGDATFQTVQDFPARRYPGKLAVGDLDGDHADDVVVVIGAGDSVAVLLGNGDGTLGAAVCHATGDGPSAVAVADFNDDDILDLAVTDGSASTVSVLLGNGDGSFWPYTEYSTGDWPVCVAAANVNGDDYPDIITANRSQDAGTGERGQRATDNVSVLLNNGSGAFPAHVDYSLGRQPQDLAVGDLDGDNDVDIAVAVMSGHGQNGVAVLLGAGNGTFGPCLTYGPAPGQVGGDNVVITNLNGDDDADLILEGDTFVSVLLGQGNGTFPVHEDYLFATYNDLLAGDFDGDTHPDLAASAGNDFGSIAILKGNGDGTLTSCPSYGVGDGAYCIVASYFNNDAEWDLVVANNANSSVSVLVGNGDSTFEPEVRYATAGAPTAIAAAYLDGGYQSEDLAVTAQGSDVISVLLGNGDATFGSKSDYATGDNPMAVAATYLDAGPACDLVTANSLADNVSVLLGDGNGHFPTHVEYAVGRHPSGVDAADLHEDGHVDLVVADAYDNNVAVLFGNGDGTFQAPVYSPCGSGPEDVFVTSVNGMDDDHGDLLVTNPSAGTVTVLIGDGTGQFAAPVTYDAHVLVKDVALRDVTGDYEGDLVVAGGEYAAVLPGHGDGTFGPPELYGAAVRAFAVAAMDLDSDGDNDLAVVDYLGKCVRVLLNRTVDSPVEGAFYAVTSDEGTVLLRWSVGALGGAQGFNVYRSTAPAGPFARVNDEMMPASESGSFEDSTVWPETTFWYELRAVLPDGSEDVVGTGLASVTTAGRLVAALRPASPNPFAGETRVVFDAPGDAGMVELAVYDVAGRLVRTLASGPVERGRHEVVWDGKDSGGSDVAAGVYFVRLEAGGAARTEKAVVVR